MSYKLIDTVRRCSLKNGDLTELSSNAAACCKELHDTIREKEVLYGFSKPKSAVRQLYLEEMDCSQIYQQVAVNDEELLDLENENNLCAKISLLKSEAEENPSQFQILRSVQIFTGTNQSSKSSNNKSTENSDDENEILDSDSESCDEGIENQSDSDTLHNNVDHCDITDEDEDHDSSIDEGLENVSIAASSDSEHEISNEGNDQEVNDENSQQYYEDDDSENDSNDENEPEGEDTALWKDSDDDRDYDELDDQLFDRYLKEDEEDQSDEEIGELAREIGDEDTSDGELPTGVEDDDGDSAEEDDDNAEDDDGNNRSHKKMKRSSPLSSSDNPFKNKFTVPEFSKSSVDSRFFNLRESEWVADEDILGADHFDDVDFMEDIEEDDEEQATYKDFFDGGPSKLNCTKKNSRKNTKESSDERRNEKLDEDWSLEQSADDAESLAQQTSSTSKHVSRLESELALEEELREQMEEDNIAKKPWEMMGEVEAKDRPVDSVLTQHLEYRSGAKHRPEITDEVTKALDQYVLRVFRTKAFDSVERQARIVEDPFDFKKKLVLDQEKSTKSLSQIYEEEYMKKQQRESGEEEAHLKQLREEFSDLQGLLRALSNAHYTPRLSQAEIKIVSNQPALRVEEATPLVMGDADMLAPQEVMAPARGEVKGDTEKTVTDCKRARRMKKHRQHQKRLYNEEKIDRKVKKAAKLGKKIDINTSSKIVKKAVKSGQIKLMDSQGASAKGFFKEMNSLTATSCKMGQSNGVKRGKKRKLGSK